MNPIEQASAKLAAIAKLQRQVNVIEGDIQEKVTAVKTKFDKKLLPLKEQLDAANEDLKSFSDMHKDDLLTDPKKKSLKLASGELGWRSSKGSVKFLDVDKVIKVMRSLRLGKMVRTKEEINKTALNDDKKAEEKLMTELRANHSNLIEIKPATDSFWAKPL